LAKSGFRYLPLRLKNPALFFAKDESERAGEISQALRARALRGRRELDRKQRPSAKRPRRTMRIIMMAETSPLERRVPAERPLSPHLQIYRPMLTMMMSIVHRITGFANYFGTLLLAWWLIAAASPNGYAKFQWFASSWIGRLILLGYTWSVIHHMLGGIRHLIWDTGRGFGPKEREWLVAANLVGSIAITVVLWIFITLTMGVG
jgi:succinate dehydrogenase / fumarate reductase cytochrome b subunit